ncbi:protein snakeskin-like [Drosophila innubila]|uniref:protein snakeskin-like n=1 Tax=Drosophila innubila TaxID=198719 RepID=UPI00148E8C3E|nr:protein snakeskin-like [Drosophila innubila]
MVSVETIGSIFIKALKLIINLVVIFLYRWGNVGKFLGIGGTWNRIEGNSVDLEIVASGVMVGFFIYTGCHTITFGTTKHKGELCDTIMNVVGTFMWLAVGGVALHNFKGDIVYGNSGIALGSLCVIEGALYLLDTVLACIHYFKGDTDYTQ